MASWSVNLEGGPWWYAHVVELPGCFTRAASRVEALSLLPVAIERRVNWLKDNGLSYPQLTGLHIVEEQYDIPGLGESGGAVALFKSDTAPVDKVTLRDTIRLMSLSREELLKVIEGLNRNKFDAEPIPGKRTVKRDLNHIVNAEEWYVSRLGPYYQRMYEDNLRVIRGSRRLSVVDRIKMTRPAMIVVLEAALTEGRQGPFKRKAYTNHPEELWTLRKVMRRFLEHEREHLGTLQIVLNALS